MYVMVFKVKSTGNNGLYVSACVMIIPIGQMILMNQNDNQNDHMRSGIIRNGICKLAASHDRTKQILCTGKLVCNEKTYNCNCLS